MNDDSKKIRQQRPDWRVAPGFETRAVHAGAFVDYLRRACALVPAGKSIYPYVFPIRNTKRPPFFSLSLRCCCNAARVDDSTHLGGRPKNRRRGQSL